MTGIREMRDDDVAAVAAVHLASWAPHEFSVRMGKPFLDIFYRQVVRSPTAFGVVWEEGGRILGYATGFARFSAFNDELRAAARWRLAALLLRRLATLRLGPAHVLNQFRSPQRHSRFAEHHLGAIAVAADIKGSPQSKAVANGVMQAVFDGLKARGCAGCWGLCDARNVPMRKYLLRIGFVEIEVVRLVGREVVLYDLDF